MTEEKKLKIEFAPGCFDSFEGTQEELDEMVAEIVSMFENLTPEELEERSQPLDIDALIEEGDEDLIKSLLAQADPSQRRTLQ